MAKKQSTALKAKALAALLDSNTLEEAAQKAGINRKTLYSYMHDDADFAECYKAAQERLTLERVDSIEADRKRATAAILALMDDPKQPGAVRLKAAQTILESADLYQQRAAAITKSNIQATAGVFAGAFGRGSLPDLDDD